MLTVYSFLKRKTAKVRIKPSASINAQFEMGMTTPGFSGGGPSVNARSSS